MNRAPARNAHSGDLGSHPLINTLWGYTLRACPLPIPPTLRSVPMTTPTPRLLPLAATGCGCCAPSPPLPTDSDPAPTTAGSPASYQVTGMTCGHCAAGVADAVRALPRVDDVQIDLAAGGVSTITVTGAAPQESVHRAIEEAGYTVLS